MDSGDEKNLISEISRIATPVNEPQDLKPLIDQLSKSRVVMLGEASHGTHEFYHWRRLISEWLIAKHGFNFIAVEGDWPPCFALNSYIRGGGAESARKTLERFDRWPTWMWANTDVIQLAEWLRSHNQRVPEEKRAGFYGLDVYSLFESIDETIGQIEKINPFLAKKARAQYACFDRFQRDERTYARSLVEFPEGCERQVLRVLEELLELRLELRPGEEEILFDAQQNARVIANAESYYRSMIHGSEDSWNVRDRHMHETLEILMDRFGPDSKAIVWAHNTHIGDYRATDMAVQGQINIGGLARASFGEKQVSLVGFGTYEGKVIASHAWDGPIEIMDVPKARSGSWDALIHAALENRGAPCAFLGNLRQNRSGVFNEVCGQRAIGVVYDPRYERFGNYVPTSLPRRYDAFFYVDRTTALEPLIQGFEQRDIPETWPQGQ